MMAEGPSRRLPPRINAMPHWTALHEDNWMVPVLARDGRRQTGDEFCLGTARDQFKAARGEVMAFIHNQMAITPYPVIDRAFVTEALNEGDIKSLP